MSITKSRLTNLAALAAIAAIPILTHAERAQARDLVVVGWGGALSAAIKAAMEDPFQEETGIAIASEVYNGGMAQVKAQIEAGNVTWDVIDSNHVDAELGCAEGLLEEIPLTGLAPAPDGTPAEEDFYDEALHDCGVANYIWANVFAYDKNKFPSNAPSSVKDFFDLQNFPGKRGMRRSPQVNLPWALVADGVPLAEVYDVLTTSEGVDRAFRKLDTIKDEVLWWEAGAQPPQMLADGEVAMTTAYNGRLYNAIVKEGQPFAIVWDSQIWDYGAFVIPRGTENVEQALAFIKYATSSERLADLTNYISYGPARLSGNELVPDELKVHLPSVPEHLEMGTRANSVFWADYGDQLNERFNVWLASN